MILPFAHLGHWLWVFYVIPVLVVIAGILRSTWAERRRKGDDPPAGEPPGGSPPP